MAEFTAIVHVEVDKEKCIGVRGLSPEDPTDYLPDTGYVEEELGWAQSSFNSLGVTAYEGEFNPMEIIYDILKTKKVLPLLIGINKELDEKIAVALNKGRKSK
jgi:hypothetical protein